MFFTDKIINKKFSKRFSFKMSSFFSSAIIVTTISFVLLLSAFSVQARDLNAGLIAAQNGDYKTAVQHWQDLAKQGNAIAQFNMALLYHAGLGVEMSETKAVELYIESAKNGYHKAQEYLTVGYREGWFGLPKDSKKADYWEQRLENNTILLR